MSWFTPNPWKVVYQVAQVNKATAQAAWQAVYHSARYVTAGSEAGDAIVSAVYEDPYLVNLQTGEIRSMPKATTP